jgi:hypothetical protein
MNYIFILHIKSIKNNRMNQIHNTYQAHVSVVSFRLKIKVQWKLLDFSEMKYFIRSFVSTKKLLQIHLLIICYCAKMYFDYVFLKIKFTFSELDLTANRFLSAPVQQ